MQSLRILAQPLRESGWDALTAFIEPARFAVCGVACYWLVGLVGQYLPTVGLLTEALQVVLRTFAPYFFLALGVLSLTGALTTLFSHRPEKVEGHTGLAVLGLVLMILATPVSFTAHGRLMVIPFVLFFAGAYCMLVGAPFRRRKTKATEAS